MTPPILEVSGLGIAFGGLRAVDDLSFRAERNAVTTIIGPNGAGKSTVFNLISGALSPRAGKVTFDGRDCTGAPPHRMRTLGLGRSFQITSLFPDLTVFENLRLASEVLEPRSRWLLPVSRSPIALARADALLSRFALTGRADELAGALSHGEQRRLEVAMAIAAEPKLLLLDEPTQGMSHGDTEETAELIRSLAADLSVLLIEHDIGLVMTISDHVVVMHQGRKLAEGAPAAVRADPAVQAAYFGHA
ncbi:ABC transporter ATP-binding protein [Enterovirga sp.]|jgi:branched-chain amino acid transport system ATP-binding protein|uniref:ABC transporter ATP-binding protein n=1 Tax=Enterovirga sp. TaxID=2026350 RepID=UPI002636C08D|nr:ABC transporter ATP-binding protein [Enterovirga sp.]MDB5590143.1 transporter family protein [Enterovirga sp.]